MTNIWQQDKRKRKSYAYKKEKILWTNLTFLNIMCSTTASLQSGAHGENAFLSTFGHLAISDDHHQGETSHTDKSLNKNLKTRGISMTWHRPWTLLFCVRFLGYTVTQWSIPDNLIRKISTKIWTLVGHSAVGNFT